MVSTRRSRASLRITSCAQERHTRAPGMDTRSSAPRLPDPLDPCHRRVSFCPAGCKSFADCARPLYSSPMNGEARSGRRALHSIFRMINRCLARRPAITQRTKVLSSRQTVHSVCAEPELPISPWPGVTIHQASEVIESGGNTTLSARDASLHWTRCSRLLLLFVITITRLRSAFSAAT